MKRKKKNLGQNLLTIRLSSRLKSGVVNNNIASDGVLRSVGIPYQKEYSKHVSMSLNRRRFWFPAPCGGPHRCYVYVAFSPPFPWIDLCVIPFRITFGDVRQA